MIFYLGLEYCVLIEILGWLQWRRGLVKVGFLGVSGAVLNFLVVKLGSQPWGDLRDVVLDVGDRTWLGFVMLGREGGLCVIGVVVRVIWHFSVLGTRETTAGGLLRRRLPPFWSNGVCQCFICNWGSTKGGCWNLCFSEHWCLVLVIWVCIVARPEGVSCGTALDGWMDESGFLPREGQVVGGVVPLMAVNQPTRGKVGPVLDGRWMDGGVVLPWACRGR